MTKRTGADLEQFFEELEENFDAEKARQVLKAATIAGGEIADTVMDIHNGETATGTLARSFLPARFLSKSSKDLTAGALSDLPYAAIRNRGGTIRAKKKMLAIPLTRQARDRWPREWSRPAKGKTPKAGELFVYKSKESNQAFLAENKGKRLILHYVLKRSVTVRGSKYLDKAQKKANKKIGEVFKRALGLTVKQAKRAAQ